MRCGISIFGICLVSLWLDVSAAPKRADASTGLGWDLTYRSVLRANHVGNGEWIVKWLKSHNGAPVDKLLKNWHHDAITSSILLDVPAFHAGERVVQLLVRTQNAAYAWVFTDGEAEESQDKPIDALLYDKLMTELRSWEQAPALSKEKAGDQVPPGYFGFLSLYEPGSSRQILLTVGDFYVPGDKGWEEAQDGRVPVAFGPLAKTYE